MVSNLFKTEFIDSPDSKPIPRKHPKVVYAKRRQTGTRKDLNADKKRKAMPSGKRISKSGKPYYEYRKNRTDIQGLGI